MLHVQQPALLRMTRAGLIAGAAAALLTLPGAAAAQTATAPCYELIPARPRIEPPAPMLVDKCSGRTWLLKRAGRGSVSLGHHRYGRRSAEGDRSPADR